MAATATSRLERLRALALWLEQQPGASAAWDALEVADCGVAGFGFRASKAIAKDAVLCTIPVRLAFSVLTARCSPTLGPLLRQCSGLRDDDIIALYLMHERAQGAASPLAAHVAALPESYDATVFWSDEELEELRGSPLHAQTEALRAQTAADFQELHSALLSQQPQLFPPEQCGLEAYRWALATVWSRAMDLPVGDAGATMRLVVPWIDMCNNDSELPVCHAHERVGNSVVLLAGREYAAGEHVHINYGLSSAAAALRLHGFMPRGARVEVPLFAEMSDAADLYDAKRRLLDRAGVQAGAAFTLTLEEPVPPTLLLALRAQRLSAPELAGVEGAGLRPGARVSVDNERAVLGALRDGIEAMTRAYPSACVADEALLADDALPERRRAAVELRLGEKRVLEAAARELALRLKALDDEPAESAEDVARRTMGGAKAPEAAAALTAYFETLLAEEEAAAAAGASSEQPARDEPALNALD